MTHSSPPDSPFHSESEGDFCDKKLKDLCEGKRIYFLTATPINNSLLDLYHLINYISLDRQNYFASLGVHHLRRYFGQAEERLEALMQDSADIQTAAQDTDILRADRLLKALAIQRSRAYVKESERQTGNTPVFPERSKPQVVTYSLRKVYSNIYDDLKAAFDRKAPLLSLALYNPEPFRFLIEE